MTDAHAHVARLAWPAPESGAMLWNPGRLSGRVEWFDPRAYACPSQPVSEGGRQAAWFVEDDFGQAVLRHYRRGGMVARLSRTRYVWQGEEQTRSFREFRLLQTLAERGVPVPEALGAAYWRHGLTYRAAILVARLAGTRTLASLTLAGELAGPQGRDLCRQVAQAIACLHKAGAWHADLNAFNILVDPQGKAWLIDFDRGRLETLTDVRRLGNLQRLWRSLAKVAGPAGGVVGQQLQTAYQEIWRSNSPHLG